MNNPPKEKPVRSTPCNAEDSEIRIPNVHVVTDEATGNEVSTMTTTRPPSVRETATGLQKLLDEIWRMGDQDECSIKHVNHALAAIICGHSWRDGADYNLPIHSKVENMEWPYTWPGVGTSGRELDSPWDDDPAFQRHVASLRTNPYYIAAGLKRIDYWHTRLANQWGTVEALYSLMGREAFIDAALLTKHSSDYLIDYLDWYWSNDLLPNEQSLVTKAFEEQESLRRSRDKTWGADDEDAF
jgi:hypothetical protein